MNRTSKRIVDDTLEILNGILDTDPNHPVLLTDHPGRNPLDVINTILGKIAEGATIVTARETDGTIVDFVLRRQRGERPEVPAGEPETVDPAADPEMETDAELQQRLKGPRKFA